jgi:hypothetical protein
MENERCQKKRWTLLKGRLGRLLVVAIISVLTVLLKWLQRLSTVAGDPNNSLRGQDYHIMYKQIYSIANETRQPNTNSHQTLSAHAHSSNLFTQEYIDFGSPEFHIYIVSQFSSE